MEKIITCTISSLSCCMMVAQPATNPKSFSTQLKQLINYAKSNFSNMPVNYKLAGTIVSTIKHTDENDTFCRSLVAKKLSGKKANELMTQWKKKIATALGDSYEIQKQTPGQYPKEIIFTNKSGDRSELVRLSNHPVSSQHEIYIDVSYTSMEKYGLTNNNTDSLNVTARVKKIIVEVLGVDENEVSPKASFTNDLGADSLDTVQLLMSFEEEFGIDIPDEICEGIQTVGQAITYLQEHAKK